MKLSLFLTSQGLGKKIHVNRISLLAHACKCILEVIVLEDFVGDKQARNILRVSRNSIRLQSLLTAV